MKYNIKTKKTINIAETIISITGHSFHALSTIY
jgi:hypothetical protein